MYGPIQIKKCNPDFILIMKARRVRVFDTQADVTSARRRARGQTVLRNRSKETMVAAAASEER